MSGKGSADVTGPAKSLLSANSRVGSFTVDECAGCNSPHALSIQPQVSEVNILPYNKMSHKVNFSVEWPESDR